MAKLIQGIVTKGIIKPLEKLPYSEGTKVRVTIKVSKTLPGAYAVKSEGVSVWKKIKKSIAREYPESLGMTEDEVIQEFEYLSQKVTNSIKFKDWREMERFMRNEYYDFTGH